MGKQDIMYDVKDKDLNPFKNEVSIAVLKQFLGIDLSDLKKEVGM